MTDQNIAPDRLLTSHEVGELLQVNPSSINKWVNQGRIAAFRTPGGHRRIRAGDLVEFLDLHRMPIPRSLSAASKRRLLVVDDDVAHLHALERFFKPYRDRVDLLLVENGIDALVQVGSFRPHLIVLDVFMPEIDGLEVCRRLKANPITAAIDVIVATGRPEEAIAKSALDAGARRCLSKPLNLGALLSELGIQARAMA